MSETHDNEFWKRLYELEAGHNNIKSQIHDVRKTQQAISEDLKMTSETLRVLSSSLSTLVANVGHLTDAVRQLHEVVAKTQQIEVDIVELRTKVHTMEKMWTSFDELKNTVNTQSIVVKGAQIVAGACVLGLIGIFVTKVFG